MIFTEAQCNILKSCLGRDIRNEKVDWKSVYWKVRGHRMNMFKLVQKGRASSLIKNFELDMDVLLHRMTSQMENN